MIKTPKQHKIASLFATDIINYSNEEKEIAFKQSWTQISVRRDLSEGQAKDHAKGAFFVTEIF